MTKKRVYELAKDLKLTTQEMMRVVSLLNISVKTHMSTLEDQEIERIRNHMVEIQRPLPNQTASGQANSKPADRKPAREGGERKEGTTPRPGTGGPLPTRDRPAGTSPEGGRPPEVQGQSSPRQRTDRQFDDRRRGRGGFQQGMSGSRVIEAERTDRQVVTPWTPDRQGGSVRTPDRQGGPARTPDRQGGGPVRTPDRQGGPGRTPDYQGGPARTPDRQGGPARTTDFQGGPARTPDRQGGPMRPPDRQGGPARTPDRQGGPMRPPDRQGGPVRPPDFQGGPMRPPDRQGGPARTPDFQGGPMRPPDRQGGPARTPDRRPGDQQPGRYADRPAPRPGQNFPPGDGRPARPPQQTPGAPKGAPAAAAAGKETRVNRKPGTRANDPAGKKQVEADKKPGAIRNKPKYKNSQFDEEQFAGRGKRPGGRDKRKEQRSTEPSIKKVTIGETVTVQELAKKMGKNAADLIKKLMGLGIMATINHEMEDETATLLAGEFGIEVEVKSERAMSRVEEVADDPGTLVERPPVVTVMGHVDHGKTSLLDAIRKTNVTATEAGGITQHIGAYQVEVRGKSITFLDTPGHEAFTAMRARGAQATDIAVLVVAADDGVMPQTVEAINHAKAAGVPIIVAVNKMDKPGANPDRVKQQLSEHGVLLEDWGGETPAVPVSALKHEGLEQLLEMILIVAEVQELKANPARKATGIVIESELDKGRGPVATMLVQKGTLQVGDGVVVGTTSGKVRAMMDYKGDRVLSAGPSTPVEVQGLTEVPQAGEVFQVVDDERQARDVAGHRQNVKREEDFQHSRPVSLDDLFKRMDAGEAKELNIVIKADVHGSVEALRQSLDLLGTDEVKVNVIHGGVGAITETDVMLAATSNAIIIGFNVRPDTNTRKAAELEQVEIRLYRVIYEAIDEVRAAMSGMLDPDVREVVNGRAEVRQVFKVPKAGTVAGCYVVDGKITSKSLVRVIRDGVVVHDGSLSSLRRFKDDVREVATGFECGIGVERFNDVKEGDVIEAFSREEIKRQL